MALPDGLPGMVTAVHRNHNSLEHLVLPTAVQRGGRGFRVLTASEPRQAGQREPGYERWACPRPPHETR
jgi:hypothetical protein